MVKYVAAFRTHIWDADIAAMAARFFAACPTARQVVLVDETRGALDIPYEKVSHTDKSAAAYGLPVHESLWYNGDYGVYFLLEALPDYDYYILSEYDIAVNLSLEPMIAHAAENGVDAVLHEIQPSTPDWRWHETGTEVFDAPWRCLLFFMVVSQRAAQALLAQRRSQADRFAAGELEVWPYCELFVASALKALPQMRFAEPDAFADVSNLRFRPRMSVLDPRSNAPGSIAHPVFGSARFIPAVLTDYPPGDYFRPGSELRVALDREAFAEVAGPLAQALLRARDHEGLRQLKAEMLKRGLPVPDVRGDLACGKPALTSSVCPWSHAQNPAEDARGANAEFVPDEYGFHTASEAGSWWLVDMLTEHVVDAVTILNRPTFKERFVRFRIDASRDGATWITRHIKIDSEEVSADSATPWRKGFDDPFVARFVRIGLIDAGPLHLRQVQVFGRAIIPPPG